MSRFKVLKDRQTLSSQEIARQMDFGKLISGHATTASFLSAKTLLFSGAGALAVAAIVLAAITIGGGEDPRKLSKETTRAFIAPPVPQLTIERDAQTISGNSDTVINYASGSKVFIPANSFVDNTNKPISGPFTIHFREFRDQVDQLLSGIPMIYDSLGTKQYFESAGMFELLAYKGDVPVFIKEGENLVLDIQSTNTDNNFNMYYLDTIAKNWIYDRDNSENNILLTAGLDSALHSKYKAGLDHLIVPKQADPTLDNLMIDFNKDEFPELAMFKGIKFELVNKNGNAGSKKTWEDVEVVRQSHGKYIVTFTKGDDSQSFETVPVLDKADLEKNLAEYDQLRIRRLGKMKGIADSLNKLRAQYRKEYIVSKNPNEIIQKQIQKGEFKGALNEYCDINTRSAVLKLGGFSRIVLIRKFGMGNWDRGNINWANKPETLASVNNKQRVMYFSEDTKRELEIKNVYLIKKDHNSTYTFTEEDQLQFPSERSKISDILVVVTKQDELLYCKKDELLKKDHSSEQLSFKMRSAGNSKKTSEDIRKHLSFF